MKRMMWLGLVMLAGSQFQLLIPSKMIERPRYFFFGYAFIPGNLLALSATLFTLGVIVFSEGVCRQFEGFSLWRFATERLSRLLRVALAAGAAGVSLELVGQWLGKLWVYPYWTTWFYWLVVIPGFAFYSLSLVESYLAAKALLDRLGGIGALQKKSVGALGVLGAACLAASGALYVGWFASHGYVFAVIKPVAAAPPPLYAVLAALGAWLGGEWLLHRRGSPSLIASTVSGYWVPVAAIFISSLPLAVVMEAQNLSHHFWRYTHFPWPGVLASWPLQYLVFLVIAGVAVPEVAQALFGPACACREARTGPLTAQPREVSGPAGGRGPGAAAGR